MRIVDSIFDTMRLIVGRAIQQVELPIHQGGCRVVVVDVDVDIDVYSVGANGEELSLGCSGDELYEFIYRPSYIQGRLPPST